MNDTAPDSAGERGRINISFIKPRDGYVNLCKTRAPSPFTLFLLQFANLSVKTFIHRDRHVVLSP